MKIEGHGIAWVANDEKGLEAILRNRDGRGGGLFWMSDEGSANPCLAIRVSGDLCDVHYFPDDNHPGFRCLGGQDLPPNGRTNFVYEGCDPYAGEETENEFVVAFSTALAVAKEFFRTKQMSCSVQWFEL
jgi:hypothetical protein